jgi:cell division protein FtsW
MNNAFKKMDMLLLITSIILMIIGVVSIYSASSVYSVLSKGADSNHYLVRQCIFIAVAFIFSLIFIFKFKMYKKKTLVYILLVFIMIALLGLMFSDFTVNNAKSWYSLGFFNFQPSEFAKPILILSMAAYYDSLIENKDRRWYMYLLPFGVAALMAFLIYEQPDLGGAIIIVLLVTIIFFSIPYNKYIRKKNNTIVGSAIVICSLLALIVGPKVLNQYQLNRFQFTAPCTRYTESTGYQVCNSQIAIKNGGLTGLGFGNSTQKYLYLPEAHTDFIFPIICEEVGVIGGCVVLLLYLLMLYSILRIAKSAATVYDSIIAYGTFTYLTIHILVNLLGVTASMPLTGVPLPLLSYGGSFNINVIAMLFICQRIAIDSKCAKIKEKLKKI